jgi:NAD(P)-dependent dehydrogenase (short-subunit alcohol dehydrogenase family)
MYNEDSCNLNTPNMNKTALITGGNSGFGYLMVLKFARNGYKVFAVSRKLDDEGVLRINDIAKEESLDIEWLNIDVTNQEQVDKETRKVKSLDVLVNTAGYGLLGPLENFTTEQLSKQIDVNYLGQFRMIKALLPQLEEGVYPKIINFSSMAGFLSGPMYGAYSASKYAVEGYTQALRVELDGKGIKVCMIRPGSFDTSFEKNSKGILEDKGFLKGYERFEKVIEGNAWARWKIFKPFRNPQWVANTVYGISQMKNPPFINCVGVDSTILPIVRKLIPTPVWNWLIVTFS